VVRRGEHEVLVFSRPYATVRHVSSDIAADGG
jgi:hypothetical protein